MNRKSCSICQIDLTHPVYLEEHDTSISVAKINQIFLKQYILTIKYNTTQKWSLNQTDLRVPFLRTM